MANKKEMIEYIQTEFNKRCIYYKKYSRWQIKGNSMYKKKKILYVYSKAHGRAVPITRISFETLSYYYDRYYKIYSERKGTSNDKEPKSVNSAQSKNNKST